MIHAPTESLTSGAPVVSEPGQRVMQPEQPFSVGLGLCRGSGTVRVDVVGSSRLCSQSATPNSRKFCPISGRIEPIKISIKSRFNFLSLLELEAPLEQG